MMDIEVSGRDANPEPSESSQRTSPPHPADAGLVLPLDDPRAGAAELTGGKAAALARAAAAGLPVLPGFVVLPPDPERPHRATDLRRVWRELSGNGARPLVVRSSSAAEDTAESSMAGRFDSVLDVRGWDAFRAALAVVRESGPEPAGPGPAPAMAVLVQPMVRSRVGGVLFGADPVAGRTDRFLVSVVRGGPDRLVGGAQQGTTLHLSPHGRPLHTAEPEAVERLLRPAELRRLAALARRAAHVFGGPQDIEFGFDERTGTLWLFQSRPITAMAPRPERRARLLGPGPVAETLPGVLQPLEEDLWVVPMAHGLALALDLAGAAPRRRLRTVPVVSTVGGRAVADLTLLGVAPRRRRLLAALNPLPGARRLAAAWRVGRLHGALPGLATALTADVDRELSETPPPTALSTTALTAALRWSRATLVSLHAQEALTGALALPAREKPSGAGPMPERGATSRADAPPARQATFGWDAVSTHGVISDTDAGLTHETPDAATPPARDPASRPDTLPARQTPAGPDTLPVRGLTSGADANLTREAPDAATPPARDPASRPDTLPARRLISGAGAALAQETPGPGTTPAPPRDATSGTDPTPARRVTSRADTTHAGKAPGAGTPSVRQAASGTDPVPAREARFGAEAPPGWMAPTGTDAPSARHTAAVSGRETGLGADVPSARDVGLGAGSATAAGSGLAALRWGRAAGLTDGEIVAAMPEVLALVPPSLTEPPRLPATVAGGDLSGKDGVGRLGPREALRLRVRWVQEFQARLVGELAYRVAARTGAPLGRRVALLSYPELVRAAEGGPLPADLAARRPRAAGAPLPDAFRLAEGGLVVAEPTAGRPAGGGAGQGVAGGRVTGTVWDGAGPRPADPVLVVRTLDPGLATLLPSLAGLVAQTGSPLSHLAVLAREMRLATVTGAAGAVDRFPPGTRVVVDGSSGEVTEAPTAVGAPARDTLVGEARR
ncbi:PEP/pyruvate-binding domain-containing protein [Streptomyces sp. B6B3]|uniref:PEP/pyruvate-binding domain-containing protein n=1 Tax=Streptomyces sp. B6B3 TaxID=3153570 RepID=UPI00325E65A3